MARSPRPACRATSTPSRTRRNASCRSADRDEIVDPDALHDQEFAGAHLLAVDVMGGLWWHRATLAGFEEVFVPRRPRLDHHRALEADKAVADLAVIMPGNALAGREGQDRDADVGALGDDLTGSDLVTPAIPVLHSAAPRCVAPA